MKKILGAIAAWSIVALGAHGDSATSVSPTLVEAGLEKPATKAVSPDEEATETAASSEGEATTETAEASADKAEAAPAKIDTFNLPRRIRSQISYTTKRMLEFDTNADGLLAQDELPKRMQGVIAKGDLDADGLLSKDELTRMAYDQIQKREAKAEAEPHEKH